MNSQEIEAKLRPMKERLQRVAKAIRAEYVRHHDGRYPVKLVKELSPDLRDEDLLFEHPDTQQLIPWEYHPGVIDTTLKVVIASPEIDGYRLALFGNGSVQIVTSKIYAKQVARPKSNENRISTEDIEKRLIEEVKKGRLKPPPDFPLD